MSMPSRLAVEPVVEPVAAYEWVRSQIKPGDVIAFSGSDLPAQVVKVATQSPYVHVAIVTWVDRQADRNNGILIAESHVDMSLPSVGTGDRRLGVQFQWLNDRLMTQPPPIWWIPLKMPLAAAELAQMQCWLQQVEDQKIPYDFKQAIGAGLVALKVGGSNQKDDSALFCSELVTRSLQIAGVVDPEINASEQVPANVVQFDCFEPPVMIKPVLIITV
jgi:hypothetical protein